MRIKHHIPFLLFVFGILVLVLSCGGDGGSKSPPRYSLSGTINANDNSAIDSDVNDPYATSVSNDTFETAQNIPNPVVLGGYANVTGSGEPGRFKDPYHPGILGDSDDFFVTTLTANQSITLYIADHDEANGFIDLDLYLYDQNQGLVQSAATLNSSETLTADNAGIYYIRVHAAFGASNYILTIGQPAGSGSILDQRLRDDFVPGDIIIAFNDGELPMDDARRALNRSSSFGMTPKPGGDPKHFQVFELNAQNRQQVFDHLGIQHPEALRFLYETKDDVQQLKLDTLRVIDALNVRPDVRYAEPNYIRQALFTPNDTHYAKQWHYPLINLPQAWDITRGGSHVVVAVVDTGILYNYTTGTGHPDIIGQLTDDGYDFIANPSTALDGDGIDPDPEDPGDDMQAGSSFHGTHVAGTIAAATNNGAGVAGVAGGVKIMALRVLGKGGGTSTDIMEALKYAAGLPNQSFTTPFQKADIINLSLGGSSFSQSEQETINTVRGQGLIIVAAAGNNSSSSPSYPAAYDGVVSVSAVDAAKKLAPYSNYGSSIDVAAPGGNLSQDLNSDGYGDGVLSTGGDDTSGSIQHVYNFSNGTSMAAPHMAGVVALMKSESSDLTPDALDVMLSNGYLTEDLGSAGRDDQYGHGLIDAYKAVSVVKDNTIPTFVVVNPTVLNFKSEDVSFLLEIDQIGEQPIVVQTVSGNAEWLIATPQTIDEDTGIGTYVVTVDRADLPHGPYYATLQVDSDQNDIDIPVYMEKGDIRVAGDSGLHYVLLLDANTLEWVDQVGVSAFNGKYAFSFSGIPSGKYILFAGTDSDNDYYIGDSGEAIGAYISLDQPSVITVDNPVNGLVFSTSFNLHLPAGTSETNIHTLFPMQRHD